MKTIERLKERFYSKDYYISFFPDHIYIINYKEVLDFSNTKIYLKFSNFNLKVYGNNFKIIRKTNYEIDIKGFFNKVELVNE